MRSIGRLVGAVVILAVVAAGLEGLAGIAGRGGSAVYEVSVHSRVIALSFDDGPDPRWTPRVLRLLARYRAHATFFVVGSRVRAYPGLVRAEVASGDEVGDHTWSHPLLTPLSRRQVGQEIGAAAAAIEATGAPAPTLFRPPYGRSDGTVVAAVRSARMRVILWNVALEHYVDHAPERVALAELVRLIRPGTILLAHDGGGDRSRTLALLPPLLDALTSWGYQFTTVSALLASGDPETFRR